MSKVSEEAIKPKRGRRSKKKNKQKKIKKKIKKKMKMKRIPRILSFFLELLLIILNYKYAMNVKMIL